MFTVPSSELLSCKHVTSSSNDSSAMFVSFRETLVCLTQTPGCRHMASDSLLELFVLPENTPISHATGSGFFTAYKKK